MAEQTPGEAGQSNSTSWLAKYLREKDSELLLSEEEALSSDSDTSGDLFGGSGMQGSEGGNIWCDQKQGQTAQEGLTPLRGISSSALKGYNANVCSHIVYDTSSSSQGLPDMMLRPPPNVRPNKVADPSGADDPTIEPPMNPGSAAHAAGECIPCQHMTESGSCPDGVQCTYCHYPHLKKASRRCKPGKPKRDRYRRFVSEVLQQIEEDPVNFDPESVMIPASIAPTEMLKKKFMARVLNHVEYAKALRAGLPAVPPPGTDLKQRVKVSL